MTDRIPAVIGRRDVLSKYNGQPWTDVVMAAETKSDDLRLVPHVGMHSDVPSDHFALREVKSITFGNFAGLFIQNW